MCEAACIAHPGTALTPSRAGRGGAGGGKDAKLYLRGRGNFDAVIEDLLVNHGMAASTEAILSGGSSGGLGA